MTGETGWLIEHSGAMPGAETRVITWLCVQMTFGGFGQREFGHTTDSCKALRFARKVDAEAALAMHLGPSSKNPDWFTGPYSVTEHIWDTTRSSK